MSKGLNVACLSDCKRGYKEGMPARGRLSSSKNRPELPRILPSVRGLCSPLPDFFNLGILVEGFDQPQVTGEAYNPAYYPALIEGCGFEKAADYLSFRNHFPDNQVFEKMMNRLERIPGKHKRTSVRSFDVKNFDHDAAIVNDVINRSFESGVFYSITDLETQKFMLKRTAPLNEMEWYMIQEERGGACRGQPGSPEL